MRILLFFDLPTDSFQNRKEYTKFRKWLLKNGYYMIQFSIYTKIFMNYSQLELHLNTLKKNIPSKGEVRVLTITEKQFEKMQIFNQTKVRMDQILKTDIFIHF